MQCVIKLHNNTFPFRNIKLAKLIIVLSLNLLLRFLGNSISRDCSVTSISLRYAKLIFSETHRSTHRHVHVDHEMSTNLNLIFFKKTHTHTHSPAKPHIQKGLLWQNLTHVFMITHGTIALM